MDIITSNKKFKLTDFEVKIFNHLDFFSFSNELHFQKIKKTLVIIDYCALRNSVNFTQLCVYHRPLNINTIYISQKYTKVY